MKITFAITSYSQDIHLLDRCLSYIDDQTNKPDEIILVASNLDYFNCKSLIDSAHLFKQKLSAGEARNKAIDISSSDIICFCDVDDELHPQKCEIIRSIFSNDQTIDMVVHDYNNGSCNFDYIFLSHINLIQITDIDPNPTSTNLMCPISGNITHGHCVIKKQTIVDNKIKYTNSSYGEDGLFCRSVLGINNSNVMYTPLKLINYIS